MAVNPKIPEGALLHSMNSMYELRHYDGFEHIGHPTTPNRISKDTILTLKHGYYASVSYVDALLGDLIAHMKTIGIYENTIIIVFGDHGWKLGELNSWGKMTNYTIDLKVPMIIRYPNQKLRGVKSYAITELIDMFPSLSELAGIPVPDYMQETSFVPLLEKPDLSWKKATFSQFHRRPKGSADGKRYMGYSINTAKYHYIEWYGWDEKTGAKGVFVSSELYNSENDAFETVNLSKNENYTVVILDLSKQLLAGWKKAEPEPTR